MQAGNVDVYAAHRTARFRALAYFPPLNKRSSAAGAIAGSVVVFAWFSAPGRNRGFSRTVLVETVLGLLVDIGFGLPGVVLGTVTLLSDVILRSLRSGIAYISYVVNLVIVVAHILG